MSNYRGHRRVQEKYFGFQKEHVQLEGIREVLREEVTSEFEGLAGHPLVNNGVPLLISGVLPTEGF